MKVSPSRYLNEKSGWMGLSVFDLAGLSYFLIFVHGPLSKAGLEIFAFAVVGVATYALIYLRLRERPKVIRDFCKYLLFRWRIL